MNLPSPLPPEPANGAMPTSRLAIVQSVLDASLNSMIAYEAMRETGAQGPITGLPERFTFTLDIPDTTNTRYKQLL